MKVKIAAIIFVLGVVSLSSCSRYQKVLKSQDQGQKFEEAIRYYEKGDYNRALQLFDAVLPFYRGTDKAEDIYYRIARCYYEQGDVIQAGFEFKRVARFFPNGKYAEESMYMNAYCKVLESPEYSLDQTSTFEAIQELQLYINMYPNSERVQQCNDHIDRLRNKLERKEYEIAKLYYKMRQYQAAITAFNNVYKDFPDTRYKEEVLFLTVKAYFDYASNSIEAKKRERFKGALDAYATFATFYPESAYMKEARSLRDLAEQSYTRLAGQN